MNVISNILFVVNTLVVFAQQNNELHLESYVRYLNNRIADALEYKFPVNARMHEAANKIPQGEIIMYAIYMR